jgi:ribonuclease BN (tRNA processing enzyme)
MSIHLRFWGVRGSCAQSGHNYSYGGHTPCVSLHTNEEIIIFDAGTGLVNFSKWFEENEKPKSLHIMLSHLHFDHVLGLPFFAPIWKGDNNFDLHIYATVTREFGGLSQAMCQLIKPPYFPISITQAAHPIHWHDIDNKCIYHTNRGEFEAHSLNHPGGCSGYKYTYDHKTVVYLSDSGEMKGSAYESIVKFAHKADLLICDTCFTEEEAERNPSWGHGTIPYACQLAKDANIHKLALFHHGLYHNDAQIKELEIYAQSIFPHTFSSRENMCIDL